MDLTRYQAPRKLPKAGEIARLITDDGLTVEEVADLFDAAPSSVKAALNNAGYRQDGTYTRGSDPHGIAHLVPSVAPGDWVEQALCAEVDNDLFYPEKGGSTRDAKNICAVCPVAAECLDYALENNEAFGVWGGMSERERRRLNTTTTADNDVA